MPAGGGGGEPFHALRMPPRTEQVVPVRIQRPGIPRLRTAAKAFVLLGEQLFRLGKQPGRGTVWPLRQRVSVQGDRFEKVARGALPVMVKIAEAPLRLRVSLPGGAAVPIQCLSVVLRDALPEIVGEAELQLCRSVSQAAAGDEPLEVFSHSLLPPVSLSVAPPLLPSAENAGPAVSGGGSARGAGDTPLFYILYIISAK